MIPGCFEQVTVCLVTCEVGDEALNFRALALSTTGLWFPLPSAVVAGGVLHNLLPWVILSCFVNSHPLLPVIREKHQMEKLNCSAAPKKGGGEGAIPATGFQTPS